MRLTPPEVFELAYGIEANKIADVLSPIKGSVEIGPPLPETRNQILQPNVKKSADDLTHQVDEPIAIQFNGKNYKL